MEATVIVTFGICNAKRRNKVTISYFVVCFVQNDVKSGHHVKIVKNTVDVSKFSQYVGAF